MTESPTKPQADLAKALGVDISSDSCGVAAARLRDAVAEAIGERHGMTPATARQTEFAQALGLDVRGDSRRVASAKIADELDRRNREALISMRLRPGDTVRLRKSFEVNGERHEWVRDFVVSTIDAGGRLYFKGGNGAGAWPTEVEKIGASPSS